MNHKRRRQQQWRGHGSATRRYDNPIFVGMSLAILTTVVLGLPSYFYRGAVLAKLPSVPVHVHGAIFSSWVILYVLQNALVAGRKIKWNRQPGKLGGSSRRQWWSWGWVVPLCTGTGKWTSPELWT